MSITLTTEQQAWIKARVAEGEFASEQEAVRSLLDAQISALNTDADDLAWAKPLVDEALAAVARGEVISLEAFCAHLDEIGTSLRT